MNYFQHRILQMIKAWLIALIPVVAVVILIVELIIFIVK